VPLDRNLGGAGARQRVNEQSKEKKPGRRGMSVGMILINTFLVRPYYLQCSDTVGSAMTSVLACNRPTQPPTLCGTGNEYRPMCGDVHPAAGE